MAPEMLFHTSYDYRVDLWALGVLLYEMVHGYAPFRGDSVAEVKENMLKGSYELSDNFSEGLKQLITAILKFDPNERVSIKEMLSSSWLQDMQLLLEDCTAQLEDGTPSQLHSLLAHAEFVPKTPNPKEPSSKETASKEQTGSREAGSKGVSTKKERNPTRNISFNLSINNFAYIKNTDRTNFNSPAQAFLEKKKKKEKEEKRCHTQAENQLMELAQSLSPQGRKAPTRRDPKLKPEKDDKRKGVQRQRARKSQELSEKSPFRTMEQSEFSGRTPSKLGSILKKRSVHEKLSSAVSSMKSLHRVKTGQRGNITNVSSLHY
jgi:serine/threonine protein kinase